MSGSRYKWQKDAEEDAVSRKLANLLKDAVSRKHKKLSFETVYSHEIILNWLQEILPEWEIQIPETGVSALSEWPKNGKCRNSVKQWLQEKNHGNPDDLIDGACEPLAYHLSSKIAQNFWAICDLRRQYESTKDQLEKLDPQVAANAIFGEYIKHEPPSTTQFWGQQTLGLSYDHYLFGHSLSRKRIQELSRSIGFDSTDPIIIPMYILCYLFDNDELSVEELKNATEETAQYSLHAVGLVMHRDSRRLFVADPNGALIGGSNMEFLAMPLKKLNHTSTTKVSAYDRSVMKRLNTTLFIAKPNGEIVIERPANKRANSNTDQVSCKRR